MYILLVCRKRCFWKSKNNAKQPGSLPSPKQLINRPSLKLTASTRQSSNSSPRMGLLVVPRDPAGLLHLSPLLE